MFACARGHILAGSDRGAGLRATVDRVTRRGAIACTYVALAMVLGGGGTPAPKAEIAVQMAFALAAFAWFWAGPPRTHQHGNEPVPRSLVILGAAVLALPLVQVVPLPPFVWQALLGREIQLRALALVNEEHSWRPLSIAPTTTLASFLAIVPAVGAMWATASLTMQDRRAVLLIIGSVTLIGAMLGAVQVTVGPEAFRLYEKVHSGWLTGFFANRNAAADGMLVGALAIAAWTASGQQRARSRSWFAAGGLAFLALATLLTGSRAGLALMLPVGLACCWLLYSSFERARSRRSAIIGLGVAVVTAGFVFHPRIAGVVDRFDGVADPRLALWQDTLIALQAWFPAGAGVGTFVEAFLPFEDASRLDALFPNRAHNDYLEFAIEAGAAAPVLLISGAVILGMLAFGSWQRAGRRGRAHLVFALGTLLVMMLHSAIDYPLRNMALACLAGVAAGMLHQPPGDRAAQDGRTEWAA